MRIYKTTDSDCFLKINIIELKIVEPILWFYNGMFCVIPIQIIENAKEQLRMIEKFPEKYARRPIYIKWDQGISVDPKIGYALLGEQSDNQS